ncbi:UNKNOWN [Stylonychia lemnae]|uniref:Band 7 domain-containing protein n=1 Tax=Stylonychia lemnae TaxID=5949 RepID=A0A078AL08_STYLE|nr:UNKNOWN [Stylonychia lemnae]|eukprot:CDW82566.1 UNKNOWN [Stylonychia lemnae]
MHQFMISNFGMKYKTLDYHVTGEIYGSGRHFSGIATDFIQYPSRIVVFLFSDDDGADYKKLSAWTINGQTIFLEMSFFAKFINRDKISDFFFEFGSQWKGYFVRMALAKIKETTTQFQELDFYNKRAIINDYLTKELSQLFLNQSNNALNVTEVQLRKIELEEDLEDAVEDKLIELQSQRKWIINQNISIIKKETELIQQYAQNNITVIYAQATANATLIKARAEANAINTEYVGYANAFKLLKDFVGFTDTNAWISIMFAEMLTKLTDQTRLNLGFTSDRQIASLYSLI